MSKPDVPFPQSPVVPNMVEGDHQIQFSCHQGISCWNACCANIDISLTPYDIVRLKKHLGISSTEFLREYTVPYEMEKDGLAGVKLRPVVNGTACRFMKPEGCGVYADRPTACRYYPVALLSMRRQDEFVDRQSYAIVKEDHCKGHEVARNISIDDYRQEQGIPEYDELARGWRQLVLKKKSSGPSIGAPSLKSRQLFFMACYDIDTFHSFVESEAFAKLFAMSDAERTLVLADDAELLQFSFRFLKQVLFGEQSIAMNEDAAKERLKNWQVRQVEIEQEAAEKRARLDEEMAREGFNEEDSGLGVCDDAGGSCSRD
ncbi:MAG: YkgJ family cysteine cluster protein [Gammaproteobacteria bacterium]|nr:YkgJ family cysteine cluster protein [Gammaproteobacteria bacterium]MBU1647064.1 YkgJ family cysteine cluster protein [Gammaproteobacteria bacterium]MBU1972576.1 YkgJ family cysteine cluster protein [Gammaproteobacteria bacterium]